MRNKNEHYFKEFLFSTGINHCINKLVVDNLKRGHHQN